MPINDDPDDNNSKTWTKATDYFALGIHIFGLLMNGEHPYEGTTKSPDGTEVSVGAGEGVPLGLYVFKPGISPRDNSKILPLTSFPPQIGEFFNRTLSSNPNTRPTADEWLQALTQYEKELKECGKNSRHQHWKGNSACPYCAAEQQSSSPIPAPIVTPSIYQPTRTQTQSSWVVPASLTSVLVAGVLGLFIWLAGVMSPRTSLDIEQPQSGTEIASSVPQQPPSPQPRRDIPADLPVRNTGFIELDGTGHGANFVVFSPDGTRIVTGGDVAARIWDTESGREIAKLDFNTAFRVFMTDKVLLSMDNRTSNTVRRWDTTTGRELLPVLEMPGGLNHQVQYSLDRKMIAMHGSGGRGVFIWDIESGRKLRELSGNVASFVSFSPTAFASSFSPDGKKFTTEGHDGTARPGTRAIEVTQIWDIESGRELQRVRGVGARFSPDSRTIATGGEALGTWRAGERDFNTRIWDVNTGRELRQFKGLPWRFFPDGRKIITFYGTNVIIWDVNSGRELQAFEREAKGVPGKFADTDIFSPDGTKFVTILELESFGTTEFRIWDSESCRELHVLRANGSSFYFSHDGSKLVTYRSANCCRQGVQIWDVNSGRELRSVVGSTIYPRQEKITKVGTSSWCEECNPGRTNVSFATRICTTRIWDINSGRVLHQFDGDFLGFSPDERKIVTVSRDGVVRIWTLDNTIPNPSLPSTSTHRGAAQGLGRTDAIPVTVDEITRAYSVDRIAAEQKYNDRWVAVTGRMMLLGAADAGGWSIHLYRTDSDWLSDPVVVAHPVVRCDFDADKNDIVSERFNHSGIITIIGLCKGGGGNYGAVRLANAEFVDNEEVVGEAKCPRCGSARVDKRGETWLCFECRREW